MRKRYPAFSSFSLVLLLAIMLFFAGCETWKGLQKDWQKLTDWDKDFQEKYW